ncbi:MULTISPECIES: ABC transporter ATP-binding protein [Paenibacillus]|uniref:ABC transporter ATP-binding protein n=1 Tax=Paenibacillus TaxID=44249 RepID=UPI00097B97F5|nr:ABC transporter ATP-binding protein [Paenibacillus macerans]MED4956796.1 ABC transporter ATP-binding protein [Paenibacillus macerans]OMG50549.1 ABC transporter ATP-binding protein [Paenibacillus macerans]
MVTGMNPTAVAADDQPVVQLSQLTKKYGEATAVDHLDLSISRGEIFGLLGPNGAGKTTTILMMLGLTEPTSGHARICGLDPTREALRVKRIVGYLPDDIGFYEDRTALDNLVYTARLNGIPEKEAVRRAGELLEKTGLTAHSGKKVGAFSRGMRQRLGLADVLIKNPEVIILDEPTLGIDPEGVRELLGLISSLSRDEKLTVLLSSHHLHQVQQICDRVGLFVQGKLIAVGDIQTLSKQLDEDGKTYIEVGTKTWPEALADQIKQLDGVQEIRYPEAGGAEHDQGVTATVVCSRDLTAQIAETVIRAEAELVYIRRKEYGLDDIYHRYFERRGER